MDSESERPSRRDELLVAPAVGPGGDSEVESTPIEDRDGDGPTSTSFLQVPKDRPLLDHLAGSIAPTEGVEANEDSRYKPYFAYR